ncbi:hypothetical protein HRbin36_02893 [bacterium HR36]|nr:hypothetical protein HRbin36_02893 [bacterium HR36]
MHPTPPQFRRCGVSFLRCPIVRFVLGVLVGVFARRLAVLVGIVAQYFLVFGHIRRQFAGEEVIQAQLVIAGQFLSIQQHPPPTMLPPALHQLTQVIFVLSDEILMVIAGNRPSQFFPQVVGREQKREPDVNKTLN